MKFGVSFIIILAIIVGGVWWSYAYKDKLIGKSTLTQATPAPSPKSAESEGISGKPKVKIITDKGSFVVELRPDLAPKTVANFLEKFSREFCRGLTFHRVENWVIQGCDPLGDGTGGSNSLPTEISNGDFGVIGSVGVASRPNKEGFSNDSQFFIIKSPAGHLNRGYTYFGQVVEGLDTVMKIQPQERIINTVVLSK
jgi:cyclophilin family peptidyl-prolyl cis-trans isomerase